MFTSIFLCEMFIVCRHLGIFLYLVVAKISPIFCLCFTKTTLSVFLLVENKSGSRMLCSLCSDVYKDHIK